LFVLIGSGHGYIYSAVWRNFDIHDRRRTRLWATAVATATVIAVALSTLVPLLVLAAGFGAVFALHRGVERIGRYLQGFHEEAHGGGEHVALEFPRKGRGAATDPLFVRLFIFAASRSFPFVKRCAGGTGCDRRASYSVKGVAPDRRAGRSSG